jgi:hypothetical protein
MIEFNILLFEILVLLTLFTFIFIYSILSADMLTSFISLLIFLILLIPFYLILERLELVMYINNLENLYIFRLIFLYSTLINVFIGLFLVVESIYLIGFS